MTIITKKEDSVQAWEERLVQAFHRWCRDRQRQVLVFPSKTVPNQVYISSPTKQLRYWEAGRRKIKRRLASRLQDVVLNGVTLTLTIDPKKMSRPEAWAHIGKNIRRFNDNLNHLRKRRGYTKRCLPLRYILTLEEQTKNTHYPHYHIFYPGLKWLAPKEDLDRLWPYGTVRVEKARTVNARSYILKYVTKLSGWSNLGLAYIWYFRCRLYNLSRSFFLKVQKSLSDWSRPIFVRLSSDLRDGGLSQIFNECALAGLYVVNPDFSP